ncbi:MAG TPA: patatin-like phospholipase family protein [Steroidobacteraceae bacterium]|nr:patatin-like phospholipase family protein [Steroidobacteraceae bacterium]
MPQEPVQFIPGDEGKQPVPGIGLCLSGGGYRAMVFHIGALWRLYEAGVLKDLARVSSVSGGSITAATLALAWRELSFDPARVQADFVPKVVAPLRALASETIDADSIIGGIFLPGTISERIAAAYRKHLFGDKTLQDLPEKPRFVINATNVQSGVLWRFSRPYAWDYRVGKIDKPAIPVARAVAASSAFPPVLSPMEMRFEDGAFTPGTGTDLQRPPFTTHVFLTDGGVYDNLGLETVWKSYQTVLVSDAGGLMQPEEEPKTDWPRHAYRVLDLIDNQVRSLRKRETIDSFKAGTRKGAYWGIRTNIADYKLPDALPCPHDRTLALAQIKTRLKRMKDDEQERLINWGYAVCDAALRKHVDPALKKPTGFPYPRGV